MAEDHGAPEVGQLSRGPELEVVEKESPKSDLHKESIARQCRMR